MLFSRRAVYFTANRVEVQKRIKPNRLTSRQVLIFREKFVCIIIAVTK